MPPKSANKPQRVAIDRPDLGSVDEVPHPPPIDPPPRVRQDGICPKLRNEDASSTNGEIVVRSNYVRVSKIPQTLHAYTLKFTRPAKDQGRIEYNKRREIRDAFRALTKEDVLKFVARKVPYATDFKTLWTTMPIDNVTKIGYVHNSKEFKYIQPNGKTIANLRVELTYVDHLADIQQILQTKPLAELPEYIRALNATVAQCIEEHQEKTGKEIDRIGANRFYLSNGYIEMRGNLRAGRGYYTSIRPGTDGPLLNINPATSAFLPPIKVSDFIKGMGAVKDKRRYVSQLLQGATLKILYIRANYEGSEIDYNSEAARLKIFTQFGDYDFRRQKFYELEDAVVGQPRRTKDSDLGTTVHDYFTQSKTQSLIALSR
jgi:eukaryotic translation initiation factor 2C